MNKRILHILVLLCTLAITSCYTDDSSQPSLDRLPFEDFTEFFTDNNAQVDTLVFDASQAASLVTANGIKINVPEDAFNLSEMVSLEIKEATRKFDFIRLNQSTLDGNTILESSGAISIHPFTSNGPVNIDNPLELRINLPSGTTGTDMQFYTNQNGWTADNAINVEAINDEVVMETDRKNWQMAAKPIDSNGSVQLTVNAVGYGSIPHDVKAFIVLSDYNSVVTLDTDVTSVAATGSVPMGVEFDLVILVMDHFRLSIGTQTMMLNADATMEVSMDKVDVEEMITVLESFD